MIYYCRHHKKTIASGKVISYCLKTNCWALKMFSNIAQVKRFKKQEVKKR